MKRERRIKFIGDWPPTAESWLKKYAEQEVEIFQQTLQIFDKIPTN